MGAGCGSGLDHGAGCGGVDYIMGTGCGGVDWWGMCGEVM